MITPTIQICWLRNFSFSTDLLPSKCNDVREIQVQTWAFYRSINSILPNLLFYFDVRYGTPKTYLERCGPLRDLAIKAGWTFTWLHFHRPWYPIWLSRGWVKAWYLDWNSVLFCNTSSLYNIANHQSAVQLSLASVIEWTFKKVHEEGNRSMPSVCTEWLQKVQHRIGRHFALHRLG